VSAEKATASGVETVEAFAPHTQPTLFELARVFFYIGLAGFGGGMAIVAMVEDICVHKRRWMSPAEFAHGVAFGQFLGAFAVNTTTFVGYRMLGLAGAVAAVVAFLTPSVALVIILSALYLHYQSVPAMQSALHGIGPIVVAVLLSAAYRMGRAAHDAAVQSGRADSTVQTECGGRAPSRELSGFRLPPSVEPAIVGATSFVLHFFLEAPVILILAAVAVYGMARYLISGRIRGRERR